MPNIKGKILKYLFVHRREGPLTIHNIAEGVDHAWNTVKKHIDELMNFKLILKYPIMKKEFDYRKRKYVPKPTGNDGYVLNLTLAKQKGLIK